MIEDTIIGNIDLAQVALYMFWVFFAGLIYYLQTENMREGFPLETEAGDASSAMGLMGPPSPKTFKLPHGRGDVVVPNDKGEGREIPLRRAFDSYGMPFEPVGDPLIEGVGPAAYAMRRDEPELDYKGHPKIVPMAKATAFHVAVGRDPRGLPVQADDGVIVGRISDIWIDEPEQLARYLEIELMGEAGSGTRLLPMQLADVKSNRVAVHALHGKHFANVPQTKAADQVTLLEEDKICAYYCGGKLYAAEERIEPKI